jgi:protease IV
MNMAGVNEARRPHPVLVALAVIGAFVLIAVFLILIGVGFLFKSIDKGIGEITFGSNKKGNLEQVFSSSPSTPFTAGIKIEGEIDSEMAESILEKLEYCESNTKITGILLDVDSPGGSVVPSQEMFDFISSLKAKKPVVAYVRDVAASGAYYTIASASQIIANRGSMIGSIGVIMAGMEYSSALEWLKVKPITIKTGKLKDSGSPSRPWTNEDREYLESLLEQTRQLFSNDVKTARNLPESTLAKMSDGRVVLAQEAVTLKLIDSLGNKKNAMESIASLTKKTEPDELHYLEESKHVPYFLEHLIEQSAKSLVKSVNSRLLERR